MKIIYGFINQGVAQLRVYLMSCFLIREECDQFALQTQQRWAAAQAAGAFKDEIAPIDIKTKKGTDFVPCFIEHDRRMLSTC